LNDLSYTNQIYFATTLSIIIIIIIYATGGVARAPILPLTPPIPASPTSSLSSAADSEPECKKQRAVVDGLMTDGSMTYLALTTGGRQFSTSSFTSKGVISTKNK
jgi:hypothetical protein